MIEKDIEKYLVRQVTNGRFGISPPKKNCYDSRYDIEELIEVFKDENSGFTFIWDKVDKLYW